MAVDKLVDSTQLDADLTSVADAIRTKGGTSAQLAFPAGFVQAIGDISSGESYDFANHTYPTGDYTSQVTTVEVYTFHKRTGLTSVSLPNATTIKGYSFYECTSMTRVSLPKAKTLSDSDIMGNCSSLSGLVLPEITSGLTGRFAQGCSSMQYVDLGPSVSNTTGINSSDGFKNCSALKTIVIRRGDAVIKLANVAALSGTPFASNGTGGTLYVPSAILASYQTASNWSTILGYTNNSIKSIESTHTDPNAPIDLTLYYADGTLIPTT